MNLYFAVAVALAAINLIVSLRIMRSGSYERSQKLWQLLLVWFIPLLGAVVAWLVLREEHASYRSGDGASQLAERFDTQYNDGNSGHDTGGHGGADGH